MASLTSEKLTFGTKDDPIRFGFLELVMARAFDDGGKKKYQGSAILEPENAVHVRQMEAAKAAAEDLLRKGGLKREELLSVCFGKNKKNRAGKVYDGFQDKFFITATQDEDNRKAILIGNRAGQEVMASDRDAPYSGGYGIMKVTLWLQDNKYGKRINANLLVVQHIKDGQAFGIAPLNPDEEFERLPDVAGTPNKSTGVTSGASSDWM